MRHVWMAFVVFAACQPSPPVASYPVRPAVACTTTSKIVVRGAVQRPGLYDCRSGMHLADAIGVAGGMTPLGSSNGVHLTRGKLRYRVHLAQILDGDEPDPELGPDDIVFVGQREI